MKDFIEKRIGFVIATILISVLVFYCLGCSGIFEGTETAQFVEELRGTDLTGVQEFVVDRDAHQLRITTADGETKAITLPGLKPDGSAGVYIGEAAVSELKAVLAAERSPGQAAVNVGEKILLTLLGLLPGLIIARKRTTIAEVLTKAIHENVTRGDANGVLVADVKREAEKAGVESGVLGLNKIVERQGTKISVREGDLLRNGSKGTVV